MSQVLAVGMWMCMLMIQLLICLYMYQILVYQTLFIYYIDSMYICILYIQTYKYAFIHTNDLHHIMHAGVNVDELLPRTNDDNDHNNTKACSIM